ncbi:MAG: hypothetical protein EHM12_10390 [Dehalococcoidia bacterium]|nr:MAG: hypothetical protein EHM12_10390 [Dehalococcoidia bacterium]
MIFTRNIFWRILTSALLMVLGSMVWIQASVSPAAAEGPTAGETGMSVQIIPVGDDFNAASLDTTPVFKVGDTFKVSIVAQNVQDPGIFGGQFEINYETGYLEAVSGSLTPGIAMQPVVIAVNEIKPNEGLVKYAASRQGNVDNLKGNVVLATLSFKAVAATEPPEGQTTTIHLQSVKLGAKGGVEVSVSGLVDLDVIIREDGGNGKGDIAGDVKIEGRAADKQDGHKVEAVGAKGGKLETLTETNGHFVIQKAPADTYTMTASRPGFLAASCPEVKHVTTALTTLKDATLLAGDINSDAVIDITDAVAIGAVFGSTTANEVADLNADGVVDVLDLILMAANFGQTSAGNPWLCQVATEL